MRLSVMSAIDAAIWGLFSLMGLYLIPQIMSQDDTYRLAHTVFYVVILSALCLVSLGLLAASTKMNLHPLAELFAWLLFAGFFPFFFSYSGGV